MIKNLNDNKTLKDLERVASMGLAQGFFDMGKILFDIKQRKLFAPGDSFSGFCKKFSKLPGSNEESKRLMAFKMLKIYIELHLGRGLSQKDILDLGFNKAYDLSGFSSTHADKEFIVMLEKAKSLSSGKFRRLLTSQYVGAVRKEVITRYYNNENRLIGSNTKEVML